MVSKAFCDWSEAGLLGGMTKIWARRVAAAAKSVKQKMKAAKVVAYISKTGLHDLG